MNKFKVGIVLAIVVMIIASILIAHDLLSPEPFTDLMSQILLFLAGVFGLYICIREVRKRGN